MTFRTRLLLLFAAAVAASVGLVEFLAANTTRQAFEHLEEQRVNALVMQFQREFARRGQDVVRAVNGIAASETALNIALAADSTGYYNEASTLAAANGLDLLELVAADGAIISSAEWPARFGYHEDWLTTGDWKSRGAFLRREELADGRILALAAVAEVKAGDRHIYITGGERLDRDFLAGLVLPEGMRVLLQRESPEGSSTGDLIGPSGPIRDATVFAPLLAEVRSNPRELSSVIGSGESAEVFHALPLVDSGRHDLFGVLLIGSSRREMVAAERSLRDTGWALAAGGTLAGIILAWWATARVTRPVQALAASAAKVAAGNWAVTVESDSSDEIGQLALAFNRMTRELEAQRERLIQAERVAAWRELARRLAHELKNPLFPLQITVENMQRARERAPQEFDEVFREGTTTLLAELSSLKQIIGRFSDFSKMPAPQKQTMQLNDLVAETVHFFEPQLAQAHVTAHTDLAAPLPPVAADPEQMTRALRNLVLNAIDAMPQGGDLRLRTSAIDGAVRLEIADTGQGLTPEECDRLFTPYYTTKTHGTGLGLAIVQSVISDHQGRISVESRKGQGTLFRIELPA